MDERNNINKAPSDEVNETSESKESMDAAMNDQELQKQYELQVQSMAKKNIIFSIAEGSIYNLAMGMVPVGTVLLYFVEGFTQSKTLLGLFTTLHSFLSNTPQIFIAKKIESIKYYKPLNMVLGALFRSLWLVMAIVTFAFAKTKPDVFIVIFYILVGLVGLLSGLSSNAWISFMARIIPSRKLSNFFSIRAAICGVLETTGAVLGGILLSLIPYPNNYGVLFLVAFLITLISLYIFSLQKEPTIVRKKPVEMGTRDYVAKLKKILSGDRNFVIYLICTALIGGFGKMSLTFQIVYAKEKINLSVSGVATASTILFIAQTLGYLLWGYVINKKGLKFAATVSGVLFIPAILLTLWMPDTLVLYLAIVLMSLAQSYRNSNENKLIINLAPDEESLPSYVGLRNTLMGPFFSLTSLFAGIILDLSNFTVLSVLSLIIMSTGVILFAAKVKVRETD